jgi:catechol 2,3-dioxygenase-like lactoylglutathione lyase family enzyme
MEQRVSLVTLGVRDLARARRFYEALGWHTRAEPGDDVVFFQAGGMVLALWDRAKLAEDSGVEDADGWGGVPRRSGAATRPRWSTQRATPGRSPTTRAGRSGTTARSSCPADYSTGVSSITGILRWEARCRYRVHPG